MDEMKIREQAEIPLDPKLPTLIRDTREHQDHGYNFYKCATCNGMVEEKLDFGDYAIQGHLNLIVIERKQNINELSANLGVNRERFERELQRIVDANIKFRYIIIEDHWSSIFRPNKYSKMNPNAIFESIIGLQLKYNIPFIFVGSHKMGQRITRSLLLKAFKYRMSGII